MNFAASMLERTAYRMWQAPFLEQKFAPALANNDLRRVQRVLDVGCGRFVRHAEEYVALASTSFSTVHSTIRHDILRIPYSQLILECRRQPRPIVD